MSHFPVLLPAALAAVVVATAGCEIQDQGGESDHSGGARPTASDSSGGHAIDSARQIAFIQGFEQGMQVARDQQKPLLLFFTAHWCKYCRQMEREAFVEQAVIEQSRDFVCVLVDADAEPEVCRQFEVRGFPTIQFVSPRGMRLNRVTGKQPSAQLLTQMRAALQAVARREQAALKR